MLAGGEGIRLRSLTRAIVGDDRPKQYVPLVGADSLLRQTQRDENHERTCLHRVARALHRGGEGLFMNVIRGISIGIDPIVASLRALRASGAGARKLSGSQ